MRVNHVGPLSLPMWVPLACRLPSRLHDLAIIGGLGVGIVVMVLVSRMARRAVMRAVAVPNLKTAEFHGGTA